MKRTKIAATGAGVAAAALALGTAPAWASGPSYDYEYHFNRSVSGGTGIGLTSDGRLISFDLKLLAARTVGKVSGLQGDSSLVGIDYRVQDGKLYGVGNAGGVYTLSTKAAATKVSQLTVALAGSNFGVDFNPAADRLRVVSDTGQNLRHDVNPGGATIVDGALNTPPAAGMTAGIVGAAYTNNDLDPTTGTTLFDLDAAADQISLQSPANSGQLAATGKLGVDAAAAAGFDIYSDLKAGKTESVKGYATLSVGGKYGLYSISLLTGKAELIRNFPSVNKVVDLAVRLDR